MIAPGKPRLRVTVSSTADRRWEERGRPHFLNRAAFERHGSLRRPLPAESLRGRTLSVSPMLDILVAVTLVLLPFWTMWRVTQWACPAAAWALESIGQQIRRSGRRLSTKLWRSLHQALWRGPVREWGMGVTAWLWLVAGVVLMTVVLLVSGHVSALMGLWPFVALIVVWWLVLRWWRQRIYRPRPLPARRRRPLDG